MAVIKLNNDHIKWTNPSEVKIGKCTKCKSYHSCGWMHQQSPHFMDFCYKCGDYKKFIINNKLEYKQT